jgi:hypothetical protein
MKFSFSAILGVLTLLATIIAAVPAFLTLNKNEPLVYYSVEDKPLPFSNHEAVKEFREFLVQKNIPPDNLEIKLRNVGNAPAKEIKLLVNVPGSLIKWEFRPSKNDTPPWADVPNNINFGFNSNISQKDEKIGNLAADNTLALKVGYLFKYKEAPKVEIYYDGVKAKLINDVSKAPKYNQYTVFKIPALILLAGIVITILWATATILLNNDKYRQELAEILKAIVQNLFKSILPF